MTWLSQLLGFFKAFQLWIVIAPWESALRVRLGRHAVTLAPGPHFRLPFLDRLFVQSTRLRNISDTCQTVTTLDGHPLTLAVVVSYSIVDIAKLYHAVAHPEATLLYQVQGYIAEFVSTHAREHVSPATVEDYVAGKIPRTEWGLGDVRTQITSFVFVRTLRLIGDGYRNLNTTDALDGACPMSLVTQSSHDLLAKSVAVFSHCGLHRYTLRRVWDEALPLQHWLMLNPSTADAFTNDPTIERVERRAGEYGFGGFIVSNLFGFRSTEPVGLRTVPNHFHAINDGFILSAAEECQAAGGQTVCAWGSHTMLGPLLAARAAHVVTLLREAGIKLHALRSCQNGHPGHPLYVPYEIKPSEWIG